MAKNLGYQFIFLAKMMRNRYKQFFNLVKHIWKDVSIAKDTITGIIKRFRSHINVNKEKNVFYNKILVTIDKY